MKRILIALLLAAGAATAADLPLRVDRMVPVDGKSVITTSSPLLWKSTSAPTVTGTDAAIFNDAGALKIKTASSTITIGSGGGGGGGLEDGDKGSITVSSSGTVWTIDDGAVTSAMIANNSIVNEDVNSSAAIAYGKLALTGSILNADLAGSIALSKLATDPLARANHTGTQLLSTISDAGTLAALNAVASAQITNGSILNEDINASAAIAYSKLALTGSILNADLAGSIAASKLVGTDIATVGTITAGTWQGTAIAATYLVGDDTAYNATSWNGVTRPPSMNAVRDLIEALSLGVSDGDKGHITVSSSGTVWTIDDGVVSNAKLADATLAALGAFNTNGLLVQTSADTFAGRTLTGTSDKITITNGDGVSGNPTITIAATYAGQSSITTLGTIGTGTWQGTAVAATYLVGDDTAYDATSWNGVTRPPSMNAVRDKIEAMGSGVSDGDKGDINVSSSGTAWTIKNGVVTAAKTSITGTPTGAKFLRDDWTWADAGGVGTEYIKLLSGATGTATPLSDVDLATPGFKGQLALTANGNFDSYLWVASATSTGAWKKALSIPGGMSQIGDPLRMSSTLAGLYLHMNGSPSLWDEAGDQELVLINHSVDDHNSGVGITLGVMQSGYGAYAAEVDGGGTGYAVDDLLTVSGGTSYDSASPAVLRVTGESGGVVTSAIVITPGEYTALPSNPVSVTGGGGSGATFDLTTAEKAVQAAPPNSAAWKHVPSNRIASLIPGWSMFVFNHHATHNEGLAFCSPTIGPDGGNYSLGMFDFEHKLFRVPKWVSGKYEPDTSGWEDALRVSPETGDVEIPTGRLIAAYTAGITWAGETDCKLYISNTNTITVDAGGNPVAHFSPGGLSLPTGALTDHNFSTLEILKVAGVASAVNELTVTNAATGNAPSLAATGGDTNINLNLTPKGTGVVNVTANGLQVPTEAYDATGWNGDNTVPTKDAVRDQLEAMIPAYASDSEATYTQDSTNIPDDNTIPQNTEGTEILSATITPKRSTSKIRIHVSGSFTKATAATTLGVAVFVDSTADAIRYRFGMDGAAANASDAISYDFDVDAGSTSARTYKVRFGAGSGNSWVNGNQSARVGGGVATADLIVEEKFQ